MKNKKINKMHKEFKDKHFFSPFPARGAENRADKQRNDISKTFYSCSTATCTRLFFFSPALPGKIKAGINSDSLLRYESNKHVRLTAAAFNSCYNRDEQMQQARYPF